MNQRCLIVSGWLKISQIINTKVFDKTYLSDFISTESYFGNTQKDHIEN